MRPTRRTVLGTLAASIGAAILPSRSRADRATEDIRHILPTVTDTQFAISVSLYDPRRSVSLSIEDCTVRGRQMDSDGRHWSFEADDLVPGTMYRLQLADGSGPIGEPWPLKTFPYKDSLPESFKLLAFTCAGGADGFGTPTRQFFKPHAFRHTLFEAALEENPDAAIAIGDHVYWDLRGGNMPAVGRRSVVIKYLAGWYLKLKYGEFDRTQPLIGTSNESVLKRVGDEQIADLYGTRFKSTPVFFVSDDHDYFENDDAEEDIVTFPPDAFSRAAHAAIARLYYPPLPNSPRDELNRSFGVLVYGRLFESPIFDCAGHLTLEGDRAGLVPESVENWLINRAAQSPAVHFAFTPSHPFGWTAGKWREWYPDVVAPEGFEGLVTNELMDGTSGRLTVKAQKYLWQKGWWNQHQRLLKTLAERPTSRFILSGDIHAQGAVEIAKSGSLDLTKKPVTSVLVGPVGTSEATWPSSARGIAADQPAWMETSALTPTREVNGFSLFEFNSAGATATLFDCGGYDLSKAEDGAVLHTVELQLT